MRQLRIYPKRPISFFLFFLILLFSIGILGDFTAFALPESEVKMFIFYAEDCPHCDYIIHEFLPELERKWGPILEKKLFEISDPQNYDLLVKLENEYGDTENDIPVIFIDQYILGSFQEIEEKLESIVRDCISQGGCDWPLVSKLAQPNTREIDPSNKTIHLAYFYQPGCRECDRVNYRIKSLEQKYPDLTVREYDLSFEKNKELELALCIEYGVPKEKWLVSPIVFVGQDYLLGKDLDEAHLEELLQKYRESGSSPPWEKIEIESSETKEVLVREFQSWRPLTVMGAGLIDGVNPCAFAVIIFFISWLTFIGRKGRTILAVGSIYTLAVFLAYFLIGIGVLRFVQALVVFPLISLIVFSLTAVVALMLGFLSIHDYLKAKKGKLQDIKLQLPAFLKKKIHQTTHRFIGPNSGIGKHLAAAFAAGFLVSLFEFPCTGQVYLPTIVFISHIPNLKTSALSYLVLYNIMFVLPLLAILVFAYWGTSTSRFVATLERHAALVKLLTALFFFGLAGYLIYTVLQS